MTANYCVIVRIYLDCTKTFFQLQVETVESGLVTKHDDIPSGSGRVTTQTPGIEPSGPIQPIGEVHAPVQPIQDRDAKINTYLPCDSDAGQDEDAFLLRFIIHTNCY